MPDNFAGRHLHIHGLVQGVGYRAAMQGEAQRLGVRGWVRNRSDGSVEAHAAGPALAVAAIIAWCGRGPSGARVSEVRVEMAEDETPGPPGFEMRQTL